MYCNNIKDRVFVVTGSSAGIGKECARVLLLNGGIVILANRNEAKSLELVNELKITHPQVALKYE